ncbi:MarC family protein [Pseudorhodoplanes sp.]|jgi:multiple antibiotic resistance protein|uniref:MarC family protein n=1 Tax=Pseudorhodoplanes sp. TaxID=1934341 RepID=UPI002CC46639|nr:MarC family protein [Pseudorhodoplanes sp.]HWV43376.1 MarC family protein [Pseudorhodoplanes sp.]
MLPDQTLFLTQLLTLWAVVDPVSHLPLFMGATADFNAAERRRAAVLSVLMAFVILTAFGFGGQYLLSAMGISLLSFQIAGGIVLFLFAVSMVLGDASHALKVPAKRGEAARRDAVMAIAVYPLATPIIAGPGSMLTIVLLMDNNRHSHAEQVMTVAALATALAGLLLIFLAGDWVERVTGSGVTQLLRRIMGLLLSALAVNLVLSAVAAWLKLPPI